MSAKIQNATKPNFKSSIQGHSEKKSLHHLSDDELLLSLKSCVAKEKEILLEILNHLKVLDSRRLYLELGYSSLWAYCTNELKYSEAAAQRRIEAMRALREVPALEEKIITGALTLTNIAKVQSTVRRARACNGEIGIKFNERVSKSIDRDSKLTEPNSNFSAHKLKLELFTKLENKSGREADLLLAQTFPETIIQQQKIRPISADHFAVQLTVNKKLLDKLAQVKSLYSRKILNQSLAETIEFIADLAIKNKLAKKFGREAVAKHTDDSNSIDANSIKATVQPKFESKLESKLESELESKTKPPLRRSMTSPRSLTKSLKYLVWQRAGATCEYTNPKSGRRCDSRHKIEIEHDMPLALGGTHVQNNLKLYCQAHNQFAARLATLR